MRYSASEKFEIIELVEQSSLYFGKMLITASKPPRITSRF
jgi:hypothetical protein